MFGAIETRSGPDVAPAGIVMFMELEPQRLTGTGDPFRRTRLLPCAVPKLAPVIVTWLPTFPVVAERFVITGPGSVADVTYTLSMVAQERGLWLKQVNASPT
jgi:hypothetical protein